MNCIYITSNLKFKEEQACECSEIFSSNESGIITIKGKNLLFTQFTEDQINSQIETLQEYSIENGLHMSGTITLGVFNEEDQSISYQLMKITNKKIQPTDTSIKISNSKGSSNDKPKKKPLTMDQKIAYVKKFYHEHKNFPNSADTYNGYKIGTFWGTLQKNNDLCTKIKKDLQIE